MNSTSTWKRDDLELIETDTPESDKESATSPSNLTTLKELTLRLLREVQAFGDTRSPSIQDGIDFYDEVSRFEIDLIKRALLQTGGHQGRAAKILNLKITTLNSKIKHYNITMAGLERGFSLVESDKVDTHQHT
jgi:transcriptional regulator with GAF, ATPase, and Fis domain